MAGRCGLGYWDLKCDRSTEFCRKSVLFTLIPILEGGGAGEGGFLSNVGVAVLLSTASRSLCLEAHTSRLLLWRRDTLSASLA